MPTKISFQLNYENHPVGLVSEYWGSGSEKLILLVGHTISGKTSAGSVSEAIIPTDPERAVAMRKVRPVRLGCRWATPAMALSVSAISRSVRSVSLKICPRVLTCVREGSTYPMGGEWGDGRCDSTVEAGGHLNLR